MKYFDQGLNKLILFGINELACDCVRHCLDLGIEVTVFYSPRMAAVAFFDGTDYQGHDNCTEWLKSQDIQLIELEKISVDDVRPHLAPDCAGFSFDSPFLLRQPLIDLFDGTIFNEHGACLPMGKGGGGFSWRIMENDREGYVVFHELVEEIDGGPVVVSEPFQFPAECRKPKDYSRYQFARNRQTLKKFIADLRDNKDFTVIAQNDRFSTYMPRLNTALQAFVDWSWTCSEIERFILAFSDPYEGAKTLLDGRKIYIKDLYIDRKVGSFHPFKWGIIYNIIDGNLHVAARDGTLVITDYNLEEEFKIQAGDRLYSPSPVIDDTKAKRVFYTATGLKVKD